MVNNLPKETIAAISLAIPVLSKAVAPAVGEWLGTAALTERAIGADGNIGASSKEIINTFINDKGNIVIEKVKK